jgi:hypothetical protein
MGDMEAHAWECLGTNGTLLCIASALGIFLFRLENEQAWWYAIIPGDLNEATMTSLLGIGRAGRLFITLTPEIKLETCDPIVRGSPPSPRRCSSHTSPGPSYGEDLHTLSALPC